MVDSTPSSKGRCIGGCAGHAIETSQQKISDGKTYSPDVKNTIYVDSVERLDQSGVRMRE